MKDGDEVEEEDVNPLKTLQWMFCVIEWFVNGAGSGTSCVRMRGVRIMMMRTMIRMIRIMRMIRMIRMRRMRTMIRRMRRMRRMWT